MSVFTVKLILSIFTTIETKISDSEEKPFRRYKRTQNLKRSLSYSNRNYKRSPSLSNHQLLKKEVVVHKKPVSHFITNKVHNNLHIKSAENSISYGPRGLVSGPRYFGTNPYYGYYRRRFPIWLANYAVIMNTLEECPANNDGLEFAKKVRGVCIIICDKSHCIQTEKHCCYYVEPEKKLIIGK